LQQDESEVCRLGFLLYGEMVHRLYLPLHHKLKERETEVEISATIEGIIRDTNKRSAGAK